MLGARRAACALVGELVGELRAFEGELVGELRALVGELVGELRALRMLVRELCAFEGVLRALERKSRCSRKANVWVLAREIGGE